MQQSTNPHEELIGKKYQNKKTGDTGTVTDVKLQPRSLVFLKQGKYRKLYHVLLEMEPPNNMAATSGYPITLFKEFFTEL